MRPSLDWRGVHQGLLGAAEDMAMQALAGQGPLYQAILDERTRALAQPVSQDQPLGLPMLVCRGQAGMWALPLHALAGVVDMPAFTPIPGRRGAVLGLALVAGRRRVLVDLDALAAGLPARRAGTGGHAVTMRHAPLALAVEYAEAIRSSSELSTAIVLDPASLSERALRRDGRA